MASTFASYFGLRSTLAFTATGQPIPAGHMYAVSSNVGPIWTNTLTVSSFSTLIGSSITISTLTVSSINGLLSLSTVSSIATSSIGVTTGNIRIGTINSAAKLHITTLDSTSVSTNVLSFVNTGGGYGIYANSIGIAARGNTLDWYSNDYNSGVVTTRPVLTMRPEGAVGIGITNPSYPLHVIGNVNLTGSILYNGVAITTGTGSIWTAASGGVAYYNGGKVGIGTATPEWPLTVKGVIQLIDDVNTEKFAIYSWNSVFYINPRTSTGGFNEIYGLTMSTVGNVGINTSNPLSKLYVDAVSSVATGICQINASASDTASKTFLSGKSAAALMPSMSGAFFYLYGTNGTTPHRTILSASSYFTGQHANQPIDTDLKTNIQNYVGLIVSSADQGYYSINPITNEITTDINAITITEALPYIELTSTDQDTAVWGVLTNVKNDNLNTDGTTTFDNDEEWGDRLGSMVRVNGLGEGAVWVTNINGNIRNGDLICSSMIPGYGRKQNDDLFHSYTVAKATMSCNFDLSTTKYQCKTITHDGTEYITAFIGCSYHCS